MIAARAVFYGGAIVLIMAGRPAASQSPWTLRGRVAVVEHRVDAGFGPERFRGIGLGLEIERRLGSRFTVGLRGQGASLQPAATGDLDRRIGEAEVSAALAISPSWGFYSGGTLRAVANDAGRQRWLFARIGAEVHPTFTGDRFRAIGRLGLIPLTAVSGLSSRSIGLDGAVGLDYDRDRVTLRLTYGLERFAFSTSNGARREEQVSTLTFRGGIRLSRRRA